MKVDMHIHSSYSPDGKESPERILKYARKIGLDAVAITDHNEIKGALKAKKLGTLPVISGIEVSTSQGHVLGYNVDCVIPRGLSVQETIEKIHDCGGVAVIAHPFRYWSGVGEETTREVAEMVDAIEVFNSRCKSRSNKNARELAKSLGKPGTAGSDAHTLEFVGRAYLSLDCDDDILECVLKGKGVAEGQSRGALDTLNYVKKAVSQWIFRGFRKI